MSEDQHLRTGRTMFLFAWLMVFFIVFLFFYYYDKPENKIIINHNELILPPDGEGHYRVKGKINSYPVEFLVDTGATLVAIPQNIAEKLKISGRYPVTMSTANGEITGYLTRVSELSFGNFTLTDVKAVIMPTNDDGIVLLGMNVLSKFNIVQQDKRLILKGH